jgi:hypothetical protein
MPTSDLFKPYLWLAAVGFVLGFLSYVVANPAAQSQVTLDLPTTWAAQASAPASGEWNFPKEI